MTSQYSLNYNKEWCKHPANNENKNLVINSNGKKKKKPSVYVPVCELSSFLSDMSFQVNIIHASLRRV